MAREKLIKSVSFLIALWYVVSIVGLNIHHCNRTGQDFVFSAIEDSSCVNVHPGHECAAAPCQCVTAHVGEELSDHGCCCSNDLHSLEMTGELASVKKVPVIHMAWLPSEKLLPFKAIPGQDSSQYNKFNFCRTWPRLDSPAFLCSWLI